MSISRWSVDLAVKNRTRQVLKRRAATIDLDNEMEKISPTVRKSNVTS